MKEESVTRGFTSLMMEGKVKQALRLVDSDNVITGVHEMSEEIKGALQAKHPEGKEASPEVLAGEDIPRVEGVIFEEIDAKAILDAAKKIFGSGGPTKMNADMWKNILCSKVYGKLSDGLAEEIALLTRRLCTEKDEYDNIEFLFGSRMVALMKETAE